MVERSEPGIRKCMKCGWLFVSPDPKRLGRCTDCKDREEDYQPRSAKLAQVDSAVHFHTRGFS